MITVRANARNATYISDDLITSGSVGIPVNFVLSEDFDGLSAIAVFEGSGTARDVALIGNTCVVPHEVVATAGGYLRIGIYAANSEGTIVIPTVWAGSKMILQGTEPSEVDPSEPTPSWAAQVQEAAAEALANSEEAIEIAGGADAAAEEARESASAAAASATAAGQSANAAGTAQAVAEAASGAAVSARDAAVAAQGSAASSAQAAAGSATAAAGSAAAAAASEAAAREVEESIPADYTDLSNDVSELKSQIEDVTSYHEPLNIFDGEFSSGYVGPNGEISQSDSYVYSTNYIPVNAGDVLTWWWYSTTTFGMHVGSVRFVCAYNSAKEAISAAGSRDTVTSYTVPSGIAYVRFTYSANGSSKDWLMCVANADEAPESYEAYFESHYTIKESAMPESVPIMEMIQVTNLLDGVTYTDGVYVSATSGTTREAENYMTSDYISVIGGKFLISSSEEKPAKWFSVAQYDENKVVIPGTNDSVSSLLLFSNASYIRISYRKTEYATYTDLILLQSLKGSDYIGNHYEVKNENLQRVYASIPKCVNESIANVSILSKTIKESPLYGKKVAWYGDSIIGNNWWYNLSATFNMTSTNCGVGGTRISGTAAASMCQASRINGQYADVVDPNTGETTVGGVAIPLDADIIIIGAGTNDWAQSVALGDRNLQYNKNWEVVEDVTTFYQACHVMFRRLCELRPNAKIIVLGTPFGRMSNRGVFTNKYGILNNQGLSTLDYGNALCEVAEMWGFNAFRYGEKIGINDNNVASLLDSTSTDGGHLHPTTDTAKKMFREATINCLLGIKYMS